MKLFNTIFIVSVATTLLMSNTIASMENMEGEEGDQSNPMVLDRPLPEIQPHSLRGLRRFLAQKQDPRALKCDKNPKICLAAGSPGPSCCKKKCVNLAADSMNCGSCGNKCKFTDSCCNGKCVNLAYDKRHCGRCNNKCKKGDFCIYAMCNYV